MRRQGIGFFFFDRSVRKHLIFSFLFLPFLLCIRSPPPPPEQLRYEPRPASPLRRCSSVGIARGSSESVRATQRGASEELATAIDEDDDDGGGVGGDG